MMYQDSSGSYLDIGDLVLYGKFKNAMGRIVSFGTNDKGDPTINVQPVNKDGSDKPGSPKTITLLKVRKVVIEKQAQRVAYRYLYARIFRAMSLEKAREVLGFPPGYAPSPDEVNRAQRKLTLKHHPDLGGDPTKMVEVNVAADVLQGKTRATPDWTSPAPAPTPPPPPPSEPAVTWPDPVSFDQAMSDAHPPSNVYWRWVSKYENFTIPDEERGRGGLDTGWVAYGTNYDSNKHVFLPVGSGFIWGHPDYHSSEDFAIWWVGKAIYLPRRQVAMKAMARGIAEAMKQIPGMPKPRLVYSLDSMGVGRRYLMTKDFEDPKGTPMPLQKWLEGVGEDQAKSVRVILELRTVGDYDRQVIVSVDGRETRLSDETVEWMRRQRLLEGIFSKSQLDWWNTKKELTRMQDYGALLKVFRQARYDLPPEDVQKIKALLEKGGLRIAATAVRNRVVARYLDKIAGGLGLGKTWENDKVRIQQYADHFKVWDLTNAGKRGKRVRVMDISPIVRHADEWMENNSRFIIHQAQSYDSIKGFYEDILHDFPGEISINEHQERGIDVIPGGVGEIKLRWTVGDERLDLKADPMEFLVSSSIPLRAGSKERMDTLHWQVKRADATIFYGWLADNEAKVKSMGIQALKDLWHDLGVRFESH